MCPRMLEGQRTNRIAVKVLIMGSGRTDYVADEPLTLGGLLDELHIDGRMDALVNGARAERGSGLLNGDQVVILPRICGGLR